MGAAEVETGAGGERAGTSVAGGEHDRSVVETGRVDGRATEASADSTLHGTTGTCGRTKPGVVRGFQRLVSYRGWRENRSADDHRCPQPVSVSLPGGGEDRHGASAGGFEAVFREYGMPEAIRTDNGAPFASTAIAGLSRLAVWWMKLGIVAERIAAGHPEQNGRHERMHRTLKQETAQPPAANRREQQRVMERFRQE